VAFATPSTVNANHDEISIVKDWGPGMRNFDKIPSVISYSPAGPAGEEQWGASLSPDAVAMVNTKLELDVQDNNSDELDLILELLDGIQNLHFGYIAASYARPEYTWKAPEDILTDYLHRIFQRLCQAVDIGPGLRDQIPVDIAITVPVVSPPFISFNC